MKKLWSPHQRARPTGVSPVCGEVKVILSHAFLPGLQRDPVTASASPAHIFLLSLDPSGFLQPFVSDNHTQAFVIFPIASELLSYRWLLVPLNYLLLYPIILQTYHAPQNYSSQSMNTFLHLFLLKKFETYRKVERLVQ